MSFAGLAITMTGIDAYQTAENTVTNDIANVNTAGASQEQANLSAITPLLSGQQTTSIAVAAANTNNGVTVNAIERIHSDAYDALFRGATSSANYYTIEQQQLQSAQAGFSEPSGGISTLYSSFETAVSQWASEAGDTNARQQVLSSAQQLATGLNTLAGSLQTQGVQVRQQAASVVSQVNGYLDQIAQLNGQIRAATAAGNSPNTYLDQRDEDLDELSQLVPVQSTTQANGSVLVTVNGQALVNDTVAYHLASPVIPATGPNAGQLVVGLTSDPNQSQPSALPVSGGQLGAYLDLYNNKLANYTSQLNTFAQGLASNVDSVLQSGYDANGNPGTPLFAAQGQTAYTSSSVASIPGGYSLAQVNASNIAVVMTSASQLPGALADTAAGSVVQPLNSANNTLDPTTPLLNNPTLANPPTTTSGPPLPSIVVSLTGPDGQPIVRSFQYDMTASSGPTAAQTMDEFVSSFNAAQLGVTASFNAATQTVQFQRAPSTIGYASGFTIDDTATTSSSSILDAIGAGNLQDSAGLSNAVGPAASGTVTVSPQFFANLQVGDQLVIGAAQGNAETVTIGALGAGPPYTVTANFTQAHAAGESVALAQNQSNAVGTSDNSAANALVNLFSTPVGNPQATYQGSTPLVGAAGSVVTLNPPSANPNAFTGLQVGQTLYLSGQGATLGAAAPLGSDTATVVGFTPTGQLQIQLSNTENDVAGWFFQTAPSQTLLSTYSNLVAQVGTDTQTATTGSTTQTQLASSIDQQRQSIQGISLDGETSKLMQFQSAYQASARAFNIIDGLLGGLISSLGAS